jgi:hypothetical protein
MDEIKDELGKRVRTKMDKYKIPVRADFGSDITQYHREFHPVLNAIIQRKAPKGFVETVLDILHSIYGFVSEFMFYSLVSEAGFIVSFIKKIPHQKSPDVFINMIPSEVKTIIDKIQYQDQIENNLLDENIYSLKRNKAIDKTNEGLEQTAKIIALDVTATSIGYAINFYASQHKKTYSIKSP